MTLRDCDAEVALLDPMAVRRNDIEAAASTATPLTGIFRDVKHSLSMLNECSAAV
jgi:hypothetical protein